MQLRRSRFFERLTNPGIRVGIPRDPYVTPDSYRAGLDGADSRSSSHRTPTEVRSNVLA